VGDEDERQVEARSEVFEEIQDLGPDGDVEGADRLIGEQDPRSRREGPGDGDALPLTSGELVGVADRGPGGQTDGVEQLPDPGPSVAGDAHHPEGLRHDVRDSHPRVERADRVLEDDLDLAQQVTAQVSNTSAIGLLETEEKAHQRRFA